MLEPRDGNTASDRLNLLGSASGEMTREDEAKVIERVSVRGSSKVIMKVKGDNITEDDIRRLDGPHVPATKRPSHIWLNDKILAFLCHVLVRNDAEMRACDASRKPTYFADSYFVMRML